MSDDKLTGTELRIWRLTRGLSQKKLGKVWGCGWHTISRWETGQKHVRAWVRFAMRGYDAEHDHGR